MKWTGTDKEYYFSKITLEPKGDDLIITMSGYRMKKEVEVINDFRQYTACEILQAYDELGRPFEDTLLRMYKDLKLDMGFARKLCW